MLTNVLKNNLIAFLEANMADISKGTDAGRAQRSRSLLHYYRGLGKDREGNAVIRWKIPSQTKENVMYDCYIAVIPAGKQSLFALAKSRRDIRSRMEAIKNADVKCFCTCPDFNWSGARYNMKHKMGSLEEGFESVPGVPDGSDIKPVVRDPQGKILVCKHLLAAFKGMKTNATSIMKDAANSHFTPNDGQEKRAESATGEFFKTEKTVRNKPEKEPVEVDKELLEEAPAKVDAAEEALNSLAFATEKLDETTPKTPEENIKAAVEEVEQPTAEPTEDNAKESLSAVGLGEPEKQEPAPADQKTQEPEQEEPKPEERDTAGMTPEDFDYFLSLF